MGIRQAAVPVGALFAAASLPALADATNWRVALGAAAVVPVLGSVVCRAAMRNAPPRSVGIGNAASGLGTVLRDRRIVLAGLWAMLFVGGQYGVLVYLVLDLTTEVRLSLATAVTLLAAATAAGAAGRMGWGWLSDHAFGGRRRPGLVLVTVSGGASAALLATLGAGTPTWVAAIAAVVGGFSLLGWQGLWIALVSEMAPAGRAGTAIGFGLTFTNAGIVLWPPLFGAIADLSGSFRWSWLMLAAAIVGSLGVLLAIDEAAA
jgi:MFS family permease